MNPVTVIAPFGDGSELHLITTTTCTGHLVVQVDVTTDGGRVGGLAVRAEAIHVLGIAALHMANLLADKGLDF